MMTMPWRRPRPHAVPMDQLDDPSTESLPAAAAPIGTERADCCIAGAAYRVVLPANSGRARAGELRLCGHHYRRSAAALRRLDAAVYDDANRLVGSAPPP